MVLDRRFECGAGRRAVTFGMLALGGALVVGCAKRNGSANAAGASSPAVAPVDAAMPASATAMTVIRNPGCGCCGAWAQIARSAGFQVTLTEEADPLAVKRRYGVPEQLASCHTALVGGYAVEGHVPMADVKRLLKERPPIKGIAVPGMPAGSPGMEVPGGAKESFEVLAFDAAGKVTPFTA